MTEVFKDLYNLKRYYILGGSTNCISEHICTIKIKLISFLLETGARLRPGLFDGRAIPTFHVNLICIEVEIIVETKRKSNLQKENLHILFPFKADL